MGFIYVVLTIAAQVALIGLLCGLFVPPIVDEWDDPEHPVLLVVKLVRTAASLIAALWFAIAYGFTVSSFEDGLVMGLVKYTWGSVAMLVAVPVLLVVLLIFAARLGIDRRELLKRSVRGRTVSDSIAGVHWGVFTRPVRFFIELRLGVLSTSVIYLLSVVGYGACTIHLTSTVADWLPHQWPVVIIAVGALYWVWQVVTILALIAVSFMALETGLNSGVTHPYFAPILGFVFMVVVAFGTRLLLLLPPGEEGLSAGDSIVDMGSFQAPLQWASLGWALVIGAIEIILVRRDVRSAAATG